MIYPKIASTSPIMNINRFFVRHFNSVVCYYFIVVSDQGLLGLSITYTISLTGMFQYVIRQSAEVEHLVSICNYIASWPSPFQEDGHVIV